VTNERELAESNGLLARAGGIPRDAVNRAFGSAVLSGPGVDVFVAYRGEQAVSSVQTTRAGKDVGIWAMVTPPELQRQGAGRALLAQVLAHHLGEGTERFYLVSTPAGHRLYESVGFTAVDQWSAWVKPA
jgi:GNAT superfamily N-acetyltransferase